MTDEELIIQEVRLCDCGHAAGHRGICRRRQSFDALGPDREVEPVDDETAETLARRRERVFARDAPRYRAERVGKRSHLSLHELQAQRDIRIAKLSPISAGNIAPSHGATAHPSVNLALKARSVDLDADPRWHTATRREQQHEDGERQAVLRQLELLDEYEGLGPAHAERDLTSEEKDAEIVSPANADLSAAEFARKFPGYGAPSTISKKRRWHERGLCTFCGEPPPRAGCHCPTCRNASA